MLPEVVGQATFITITSVLLLLIMCTGCRLISSDEVVRTTSPGEISDAIITETNGGATTSFGYDVYVAPKGASRWRGKHVASLNAAVRNSNAYGVNVRWVGRNELVIEYLNARQQTLTAGTVEVRGSQIRVALRPGVEDAAAPAGGMLYNLQRQARSE